MTILYVHKIWRAIMVLKKCTFLMETSNGVKNGREKCTLGKRWNGKLKLCEKTGENHHFWTPAEWWTDPKWWFFFPDTRMDRDIERACKACTHCQSGKMRREKIKSEFDALAPQSKAGPRQHYDMDFYGLAKCEILVIVDLFTRETILQWLPTRRQEKVHKQYCDELYLNAESCYPFDQIVLPNSWKE